MLSFTTKPSADPSSTPSTTPVRAATTLIASQGMTMFLWCATARDLITGSNPNLSFMTASRTATTCYMRGIAHSDYMVTNSGIAWLHRRVAFTAKGLQTSLIGNLGAGWQPQLETSNGYVRLQPWITAPGPIDDIVFKGAPNIDWDDRVIAPIDNSRITVKSDVTRRITSGNQSGNIVCRKTWYPMNSNLVYDDDERGGNKNDWPYSSTAKAGMGDYWILDLFQPAGGGSGDTMSWRSEATLYWHER